MLQIKALHVEDFGPFKGHQTVNFSPEEGVTVIYGENMRGKTSLLNAVRFAFFGKVLGRGTKTMSLHKVGNWEQAACGKFGFQVQLEFKDDMSELERWESRFSQPGYWFGTAPNAFLASQAHRLVRGQRALMIGDGEGRNGVWLAEQGLDVLSVDFSPSALAKARTR